MVPDWHTVPVEQVASELVRLNRGRTPGSFEDCCTVVAALNWQILFLPPSENQVAHSNEKQHVIYIPHALQNRELFEVTLHEISEVITAKEGGEPEFHFEGNQEEHHHVAELLVDRLSAQLAAERESLKQQAIDAEAMVNRSRQHLAQLNAEIQAFMQTVADRRDTYGLPFPDRSTLHRVAQEANAHVERLESIQARLRCI